MKQWKIPRPSEQRQSTLPPNKKLKAKHQDHRYPKLLLMHKAKQTPSQFPPGSSFEGTLEMKGHSLGNAELHQ